MHRFLFFRIVFVVLHSNQQKHGYYSKNNSTCKKENKAI